MQPYSPELVLDPDTTLWRLVRRLILVSLRRQNDRRRAFGTAGSTRALGAASSLCGEGPCKFQCARALGRETPRRGHSWCDLFLGRASAGRGRGLGTTTVQALAGPKVVRPSYRKATTALTSHSRSQRSTTSSAIAYCLTRLNQHWWALTRRLALPLHWAQCCYCDQKSGARGSRKT